MLIELWHSLVHFVDPVPDDGLIFGIPNNMAGFLAAACVLALISSRRGK